MRKILVLEDNSMTACLIKEIIDESDVKADIYIFDNVKDAYQCALEKPIDCFLVDIILNTKFPGDTSGLQFVDNIRKIQKYVLTPVIFMTSLEDTKLYTYEKLHCYCFLEKPFRPEILKTLLEQCFVNAETKRNKTMYFQADGVVMAVDLPEVVYVETIRRELYIHTLKLGTLKVPYKTIKAFLQEADSEDLIQCSRYSVFNRAFLKNYDPVNRMIHLKEDRGILEVGRHFKKAVEEKLGI